MGHSNQSYTEMYSGWPPANDGMIPPLIWRYINDNTTGLPQVTTTQLSSRSVEDQEESETNKVDHRHSQCHQERKRLAKKGRRLPNENTVVKNLTDQTQATVTPWNQAKATPTMTVILKTVFMLSPTP
jgi:hypothetical protein